MIRLLALAALLAVPAAAQPLPPSRAADAPAPASSDGCAAAWQAPLAALVGRGGAPDYTALAREPARARFRAALACVEQYDAATLRTDAERLAFWMNAYNVQMVQNVLDAPGTRNVLDQRRAFFQTPRRFAGRALSLDDVENGLLRRQSTALRPLAPSRLDARLHAGLFCGAVSCPPLLPRAFAPATVHAQLDAATRAWVNSPRFARTDRRSVVFSSLLDWFGEDFDASGGGKAGDFFVRYLGPSDRLRERLAGKTAAQIKATGGTIFQYDWTLSRR